MDDAGADPIWNDDTADGAYSGPYARALAGSKFSRYYGGCARTRAWARRCPAGRRRGLGIYLLPVPETHEDVARGSLDAKGKNVAVSVSARVMAGETASYQRWEGRTQETEKTPLS